MCTSLGNRKNEDSFVRNVAFQSISEISISIYVRSLWHGSAFSFFIIVNNGPPDPIDPKSGLCPDSHDVRRSNMNKSGISHFEGPCDANMQESSYLERVVELAIDLLDQLPQLL